jgi:hypothetical protein
VRRDFHAYRANELLLSHISEHPTAEGGRVSLRGQGGLFQRRMSTVVRSTLTDRRAETSWSDVDA